MFVQFRPTSSWFPGDNESPDFFFGVVRFVAFGFAAVFLLFGVVGCGGGAGGSLAASKSPLMIVSASDMGAGDGDAFKFPSKISLAGVSVKVSDGSKDGGIESVSDTVLCD